MQILIMDPPFAEQPEFEQHVTGPEARITLWRTSEHGPAPAELLRASDALVNYRIRDAVTAREVEQLDRCRIVVQAGVGFDHLDVAACTARGIPVCNCPDYGTMEVADHAIALMLALTRGVVAYDRKLRDRRMEWNARGQANVRRISGQRFAVLGLGRIGLAAALRARGFGMSVVFYDPYLPAGIERALGFERVASVAALIAAGDVLSVHTPLTTETRGLIDAKALEHARPHLLIVNTARGPVIDLDALYDALSNGRVAGCGLDVLPEEPLDYAHPLIAAWAADEVWLDGRMVVTPHAAYYSADGAADMRRLTTQTIVDYFRDGTLRSCVNGLDRRRDAPV